MVAIDGEDASEFVKDHIFELRRKKSRHNAFRSFSAVQIYDLSYIHVYELTYLRN